MRSFRGNWISLCAVLVAACGGSEEPPPDAGVRADAELFADAQFFADAEPAADAEFFADAEPAPDAEPTDAEFFADAEPTPDAEPAPDAEFFADAEPAPDAEFFPDAEPAPDAEFFPDAEPAPDAATGDSGITTAADCIGLPLDGSDLEIAIDWYGRSPTEGFSGLASLTADARYLMFTPTNQQFRPFDAGAGVRTLRDLHTGRIDSFGGMLDDSLRYRFYSSGDQLYVHDRLLDTTELISVDASGTGQGNAASYGPIFSRDATRVLFQSTASNLIANGTNAPAIYLRDRLAQTTVRVSHSGNVAPNGLLGDYTISADGNAVAFSTTSSNLIAGDTNNLADIFLYDVATQSLTRGNVDASGTEANGATRAFTLSADGRFLAFSSLASNLDPTDTDGQRNVFVKDRLTGTIERLPGYESFGYSVSMTDDARFVAFSSFSEITVVDRVTQALETIPTPFEAIVELSGDGSVLTYDPDNAHVFARRVLLAEPFADPQTCAAPLSDRVEDWQWKAAAESLPYARYGFTVTHVGTGEDAVVYGGVHNWGVDGIFYDGSNHTLDELRLANAPDTGGYGTATWTGNELLVFGGIRVNDAVSDPALVDPYAQTWSAPSAVNRPANRYRHTAVWTGSEVIIWGGRSNLTTTLGDGARYNPVLDQWTTISAGPNAPSARSHHLAAWTGSEMIIYGGVSATGARYEPLTDLWSPMSAGTVVPRDGTWTGSELFVWNNGAGERYHAATDTWSPVASGGPLGATNNIIGRPGFVLVFAEQGVAAYELATDSWIPLEYPPEAPVFGDFDSPIAADLGTDIFFFATTSARFGPL